jgi:hypothetical protein
MNRTASVLIALALTGCAQLAPMTQGTGLNMNQPGGPGAPGTPTDPAAPPTGPTAPSNPTSGEETRSSSGPKTVSVTIRSACSKTVPVFYGDKPKFGSGTRSTVSSNSVSNKTFEPGDMMWVTDDKEEGLASAKIEEGTKELEIGSDCRSIKVK